MTGYIYKIILNNNKSYIGMKISQDFDEGYIGSSSNKAYWTDIDKYGIKEHANLGFFDINTRHELEIIESEYIKENGIWPDTYNYYYFNNNIRVSSLDKYEKMSKEDIKIVKSNYRKNRSLYIKQWKKGYYQKNKEVLSEKQKEYYQKNKEVISEKMKIYYKKNKNKWSEYSQTEDRKKYMRNYSSSYNNEKNELCMSMFGKSFSTVSRRAKKESLSYKEYIEKYKTGGDNYV